MCVPLTDLQNVDITLRVLFRPKEESLPHIYANIGIDYDERILPSITTEVLKAVVVSTSLLLSVHVCVCVCACVCVYVHLMFCHIHIIHIIGSV